MATSSNYVALEQESEQYFDANTNPKKQKRDKILRITALVIILLSIVIVCIFALKPNSASSSSNSSTNTQSTVVQQRAISTSLNSKLMASKYPDHVTHDHDSDTIIVNLGTNRRLQQSLNDEYDYAYVGSIYVNINDVLQSIPVVFDSGSSDFWITSNDFCVDCSVCTNPSYQTTDLCQSFSDDSFTAYYPNTNNEVDSTTLDNQINEWTDNNGQNGDTTLPDNSVEIINGGAWTGTATDTVCNAEDWIFCIQYEHGKTEGIYTKSDFTIDIYDEATVMSEWIAVAYVDTTGVSYHANGVFGLGMEGLAVGVESPLKQMVDAGTINNQYWFMHFEPTSTSGGNGIGYIQFGGDTSSMGEFTGVFDIIEDSDYFEIEMESIYVGDVDISISSSTALLDTGTSFIIGPQSDIESIISNIMSESGAIITLNNDYGLYTVDCSYSNSLPDISIKMTGQDGSLSISSDLYVFTQNTIDGECIVGLRSLDEPHDLNNAYILGDVYLKTIGCVQFDLINKQILYSQESLGCQVSNTQMQ